MAAEPTHLEPVAGREAEEDPVVALLLDVDGRHGGWRTPHTPAWRAQALALLRLAPADTAASVWCRVGAAVRDLGLLGSGGAPLACAVDVASRPGDVLWRDVRHALLASHGRPADGRWLAALVVWLRRQRGVVVAARAGALRRGCPYGALALARSEAAWQPAGVTGEQELCRTRAVWVSWAVDPTASAEERAATVTWLRGRPPQHATRSLQALSPPDAWCDPNVVGP